MHIIEKIKAKKKGFVIIESLGVLLIVLFFSLILNKIIINNIKKSNVYYIAEDIKTLTLNEEKLLMEAIIFVNKEDEVKIKIKEKILNENNNIQGEDFKFIIKYSQNKNLSLVLTRDKTYIEEVKSSNKRRIGIETKLKESNEIEFIMLTPKYYETKFF
ncbi:hypothetical protein [Clostridium septicum]|uniref:Uncharacterized protein n=1 Tax=Clostridium septicum TaxID=1504 RepID=A0A9N7JP99_CLOSE|nr:hypothetical protein [Clostridium septicum]AYE35630.1 hypothetical protein CP523_14980 [Clostridium septicum]MDU1313227.1 hypothetical protein [Clostridium septicum]QAS61017.1 hypothetical protein EI377_09935 [Clostridium septicum]UEC19705.1 hypothetical protein LK444_09755 [Clostridium septicum]USS02234.1 hypothetical protein NH397_07420 [Clostridium septicum]